MILAEKISTLRKKSGWSQEELAMQLNVSRQSVSKWESASSVPDLDKILQLSQLFGVSTDYLLKDEIEEEAGGAPDTYTEESQRSVGLEEANVFLEKNRQAAKGFAAGAAACILSPVTLILLGGLADYSSALISEDLAGGLGTVILLLIVCAGVGLFLFNGMKLEPYKFLEEQTFTLQYGVRGLAQSQKTEFEPVHQRCIIAGISLCISSVIPLLAAAAFQAGDLAYIVMVDVLLLLIACGAALLIWAGLDGIVRDLPLPPSADLNLYEAPAQVLASFRRLPATLEEAQSAAAKSPFIRSHLPAAILSAYTQA